jgi:hypothetical protein
MPANCSYPETAVSSPCPPPLNPTSWISIFRCCKWTWPIQAPNFPCTESNVLFHCSGCTKVSLQVWSTCLYIVIMPVFTMSICQHFAQLPNWRTTPCQLLAIAYSMYSQLPSILEAVPVFATRGRAIPWWHRPIYHAFSFIHVVKSWAHRTGGCPRVPEPFGTLCNLCTRALIFSLRRCIVTLASTCSNRHATNEALPILRESFTFDFTYQG